MQRFLAAVAALSIDVSRETIESLSLYVQLLEKWQKSINLVANSTLEEVWSRHLLDSAQLVPHIPNSAQSLLDLGSGAGFPGMVLAILTKKPTRLIEADHKKSAFLREVARQTRTMVTVETIRIGQASPEKADIVTARALASVADLVQYSQRFLTPAGFCLFLKGQNWRKEMDLAQEISPLQIQTYPSITNPLSVILKIEPQRLH